VLSAREQVEHCVAEMVDALADSLTRGAGADLPTTDAGRRLLDAPPELRGVALQQLAEAIEAWPRGATMRPTFDQGPRLLARLLDQVAVGAVMEEAELVEVLERLARLRPSPGPLDGVVRVAEASVANGAASDRLRRSLVELRHGLPLEARSLRRRLQQLLHRLGHPDR